MTPKQITELDGMPGTIQGVHKRAKKEGWPKRSQEGRRGPGVEYIPAIPAMQKIAIEEILSMYGVHKQEEPVAPLLEPQDAKKAV